MANLICDPINDGLTDSIIPQVKTEEGINDENSVPNTPITPKKRGKNAVASTPSKRSKKEPGSTPASSAKKGTKKDDTPTVTSKENLTSDQRILLKMKDVDKLSWAEITKFFETAHGRTYDPTGSTWRKRYNKLKADLIEIDEADLAKLDALRIRVQDDVDSDKAALLKKYEDDKKMLDKKLWARVADALTEDGGNKYPGETLEKAFKKGMVPAAPAVPATADDAELEGETTVVETNDDADADADADGDDEQA